MAAGLALIMLESELANMHEAMFTATVALPDWLFEQDYLIFLSLFGWLLIALLSWAKPLGESNGGWVASKWNWFGLFGMAQAVSELAKILSFTDTAFQPFNLWPAFEMLGYGILLDHALRSSKRFRGKYSLPLASTASFILGLTLQTDSLLYIRIVAATLVLASCASGAKIFLDEAKVSKCWQCRMVAIGLMIAMISFVLDPRRQIPFVFNSVDHFSAYPYFGFNYLVFRIVAAWFILFAFWGYYQSDAWQFLKPYGKTR